MRALTDERVRNQEGPFDHPELLLPDGIQSINGSTVVERITVSRQSVNTECGLPIGVPAMVNLSSRSIRSCAKPSNELS